MLPQACAPSTWTRRQRKSAGMSCANVAAVPWFWDKTPNVVAKNVHGVVGQWNAAWDLSYMSIIQ